MAEEFTLTTPIPKGTITSYRVTDSAAHYETPNKSRYSYTLVAPDGVSIILYTIYDTVANNNLATTRLKQMNTMNFSTTSQHKRVLQFAQTDVNPETGQPFLPPGTVTGTPDP